MSITWDQGQKGPTSEHLTAHTCGGDVWPGARVMQSLQEEMKHKIIKKEDSW